MIAIPRGLARSFRAAARKCTTSRTRAPVPPVSITVTRGRLTLSTQFEGVTLAVEVEHTEGADLALVVPMSVLDAVEGAAIELSVEGLSGTARWEDRDGPKTAPFEALVTGPPNELPPRPETWQSVPVDFLTALHECGRTAATEPGRYALHRVQLDGKAGKLAGTNSKQALIWGGFRLPWTEALLVPAVPVFGRKELSAAAEIQVGRTDEAVVVRTGHPWTVWLSIDAKGRFPDVAGVVPRPTGAARVTLDDGDAADLLAVLPELPGADADCAAVTLDLDGSVTVRGWDEASGVVRDVRLERSSTAGPPVRVALDRRILARAVGLGCRSLRLHPTRPLVAEGPERIFLAVPLAESCVVPPPAETPLPAPIASVPLPPPEPERRMLPMTSLPTNGQLPPALPGPPAGVLDPPDPVAEAEGLWNALLEAAARAGRLVQGLKRFKRPKRVLPSAPSLQSLAAGPGGGDA